MNIILIFILSFTITAFGQNLDRLNTLLQDYESSRKNFAFSAGGSDPRGTKLDHFFMKGAGARALRSYFYPRIYLEVMSVFAENEFLEFVQSERTLNGILLPGFSDLFAYHSQDNIITFLERTYENGDASRRFLLFQLVRNDASSLELYAQAVFEKYKTDRSSLEKFFSTLSHMMADREKEFSSLQASTLRGSFVIPALNRFSKLMMTLQVDERQSLLQALENLYVETNARERGFIDAIVFPLPDAGAQHWVEDAVLGKDFERSAQARLFLRTREFVSSAKLILRLAEFEASASGAQYKNYAPLSYKIMEVLDRSDAVSEEAKKTVAWMLKQNVPVVLETAVKILESSHYSEEEVLRLAPAYLNHANARVRLAMFHTLVRRKADHQKYLAAMDVLLEDLRSNADPEVRREADKILQRHSSQVSNSCQNYFVL